MKCYTEKNSIVKITIFLVNSAQRGILGNFCYFHNNFCNSNWKKYNKNNKNYYKNSKNYLRYLFGPSLLKNSNFYYGIFLRDTLAI